MNDKFEYIVRTLSYFLDNGSMNIDESELDNYGLEGWELVAIHNNEIVFKRKIKGEDE